MKAEVAGGVAGRVQRFQSPRPPVRGRAEVEHVAFLNRSVHDEPTRQRPGRPRVGEDRDAVLPGNGCRRADVIGMVMRQHDAGQAGARGEAGVEQREDAALLVGSVGPGSIR